MQPLPRKQENCSPLHARDSSKSFRIPVAKFCLVNNGLWDVVMQLPLLLLRLVLGVQRKSDVKSNQVE
jgi:hypothetical protein